MSYQESELYPFIEGTSLTGRPPDGEDEPRHGPGGSPGWSPPHGPEHLEPNTTLPPQALGAQGEAECASSRMCVDSMDARVSAPWADI